MLDSSTWAPVRSARRLILIAVFATGLAVALGPHIGTVLAADLPAVDIVVQAGATPGNARTPEAPPASNAPEARRPNATPDDAKGSSEKDADTADEDTSDSSSPGDVALDGHVTIEKGSKHIRIHGLGRDHEYDSFQQFVQDAPWLAGLVFLTVLMVFLVPLLIIVLLIWYKLRKNRLANETMLKLAERGVVAPSAAMDAVASGTASSLAAAVAPAGNPAYDQARFLHRRTVWSDLRKGVILSAVGLGLSFYSMFDNGTPNGPGLIVLFVGLGYCVLWFLEDRTATHRGDTSGPPPPGGA
ncbi:MAG: DUF6249 domain-containing protein [Pseudomonadota bacterium]|nr:DUF6249 domain-containing protein [Pseudomonadota bacterium]